MSATTHRELDVVWHDVECGDYVEDLPLWRELAGAAGGPILDVGAGTGRASLDLAGRGHPVIALDRDSALLSALVERAGERPVTTLLADARSFVVPEPVALCLVPMQTLQLLGPVRERARFLGCAARALRPGGLLAAALADALEAFDADYAVLPAPDVLVLDRVRYESQPVAVREAPGSAVIERIRTVTGFDGRRSAEGNSVRLHRLSPAELEREGRAAGFVPAGRRRVPATKEYVGSEVVLLRA